MRHTFPMSCFLHINSLNKQRYWKVPQSCDFRMGKQNDGKTKIDAADITVPPTCSLLDWMGLLAAELGATLLCCVSAPNCNQPQTKTWAFSSVVQIFLYFISFSLAAHETELLLIIPVTIFSSYPAQNKVLDLKWAYQANVTEVKQTEWSGGDCFSLDEVLQHIRGCRLDIAIVLTQHAYTHIWLPIKHHSHTKASCCRGKRCHLWGHYTQTHHHLIQQLIDQGKVHLHRFLRQTAAVILN